MTVENKKNRTPLEIIKSHVEAMHTNDVDIILADYADDAIVITNFTEKPLVGKDEIRKLVEEAVKERKADTNPTHSKVIMDEECGDYALHIFENKEKKSYGVETFVVRDDKIIFESSSIKKFE